MDKTKAQSAFAASAMDAITRILNLLEGLAGPRSKTPAPAWLMSRKEFRLGQKLDVGASTDRPGGTSINSERTVRSGQKGQHFLAGFFVDLPGDSAGFAGA